MQIALKKYLVIFAVVAGGLLPAVSDAAAVFCRRDVVGVRLVDNGRLQVRTVDAETGGNNMLMVLCSTQTQMGTIEPELCSALHSQLLAALHTDSKISVQFRDTVLDDSGLWGGTCDSLTHHADFSSATTSIETQG